MICYACYDMHDMMQPPTRDRTLARTYSIEAGNGELLETTYYYTPLVFTFPEIRNDHADPAREIPRDREGSSP